MWKKGNPRALLERMQTGAAMVESGMKITQNIKNGTALWLSNPTSGNLSKEIWNTNSKEYMHLYIHCSIIYNSQDLEAAQVFISRWVDTKAVIHLYNEILLSCKKEGNVTFSNSMHGPREYCAMWNKPVRERLYHIISLTCGI